MNRYVSDSVRNLVAKRANYCCEYCRIHQDDLVFTYQVDHIISLKHNGTNQTDNLAYTCSLCNQNKGTDLGTYIAESKRLIRLFNPRTDKWEYHFQYSNGEILAKTKIALATIKVLDLNNPERIILRRVLEDIGNYPR
jgi:HNH endonuclease